MFLLLRDRGDNFLGNEYKGLCFLFEDDPFNSTMVESIKRNSNLEKKYPYEIQRKGSLIHPFGKVQRHIKALAKKEGGCIALIEKCWSHYDGLGYDWYYEKGSIYGPKTKKIDEPYGAYVT